MRFGPQAKGFFFQFALQTSSHPTWRQPPVRGSGKSLCIPLLSYDRPLGSQSSQGQSLSPHPPHPYTPQPSSLVLASSTQPFNFPPAHALAEQLPPNASERFLETFLPSGHPPLPGSLLRRPDLAEVLDILGISGPAAFYNGGNLTLEMVVEVSVNSGRWGMPSDLTAGMPSSPFLLYIVSGCVLHKHS